MPKRSDYPYLEPVGPEMHEVNTFERHSPVAAGLFISPAWIQGPIGRYAYEIPDSPLFIKP